MVRCIAVALAALLAAASLAGARPLSNPGRRLAQRSTTVNIEWDLVYVPYARLDASCGDMLTFRWQGSTPQTVAEMKSDSPAAVLAQCTAAEPLTEATTSGEHTVELLEPGTFYFVEPTSCVRGQVVAVTVACDDDVAAQAVVQPTQPLPSSDPGIAAAATTLAPAPAT